MSKTNTWENDLLLLLFNNVDAGLIGDATGLRGSTVAGNFYVSLHTGDPGEAGNQTSQETTFGGYVRIPVARTSSEWVVVGNQAQNLIAIVFNACTAGSATINNFGIGTAPSGTGKLLYKGELIAVPVSFGTIVRIPPLGLTAKEE